MFDLKKQNKNNNNKLVCNILGFHLIKILPENTYLYVIKYIA